MNHLKWVIVASIFLLLWIPPSIQTGCGFRMPYDDISGNGGKIRTQMRIVGGQDSLAGEWPWAVSLQKYNIHFCTGSILSACWILSAAHCFIEEKLKGVSVQVGATILGKKDRNLHQIEKLLKHQDFSRETADNDIALLLLSSPIEINRLTTPICLPPVESFKIENWKSCHVAGWGLLSEGGTSSPSILQNVEMVLIDWDKCLGWMWIITKNMLCAGYEEGGKDACQGDSGGPLMCRKLENNTWYQVGIVSWGEGCGRKNTPGIYTFLPNYLTWIQKATTEAGRPLEQNSLHMPQEACQQANEDKSDTNKNSTETPPKSCSIPLMHGILMCQYLWFSVAVLQESTRFIR